MKDLTPDCFAEPGKATKMGLYVKPYGKEGEDAIQL